jgi:hypothetical protein
MLQLSAVKREAIDAWLVADSGLPVRVVNSLSAAEVKTVGELRAWSDQDLLGLRSLGRISLTHIRQFFRLCGQIEQGRQSFQSVRDVLSIFLDGPELNVLAARYGFSREDLAASDAVATLQEIGDAEHKTRERIRQIQETASRKLRSRLAWLCLEPFYDLFVALINTRGRSAGCGALEPLRHESFLAGYNVCSVLLLLSQLHPERITFHNGFFSTVPYSIVRMIESQALALLARKAQPVHLDDIIQNLPPSSGLDRPEERKQTVSCIMDHSPAVAATQDSRYFLYAAGTQAFLIEILRQMKRPAHYRAVTDAFNDRLKPLSRKGAGFILEMLNANPQCTRADRGIYDLKAV